MHFAKPGRLLANSPAWANRDQVFTARLSPGPRGAAADPTHVRRFERMDDLGAAPRGPA
jgi:hypothetical protein